MGLILLLGYVWWFCDFFFFGIGCMLDYNVVWLVRELDLKIGFFLEVWFNDWWFCGYDNVVND